MNSNLTGLDVKRAEDDIRSFDCSCAQVGNDLHDSFLNLYAWLRKHWASDNAVAYTTTNIKEINETTDDFLTTKLHILDGAVDAASNLARANGMSFNMSLYNREPGTKYTSYNIDLPCSASINGVSGIDVEGAKIVLTTFELQMRKALAELDALPDGIAFYDPDGTMIGKYDRNLKEFKTKFESLLSSMKADITGYLDTEVNNVLLAKEKAVDSMTA